MKNRANLKASKVLMWGASRLALCSNENFLNKDATTAEEIIAAMASLWVTEKERENHVMMRSANNSMNCFIAIFAFSCIYALSATGR